MIVEQAGEERGVVKVSESVFVLILPLCLCVC